MDTREQTFDTFGYKVEIWESGLMTSGELFTCLLDALDVVPTVPFLRSILCLVPYGTPREDIKSQIWSILSTQGQGVFTIRSFCGQEKYQKPEDLVLSPEVFATLEAWGAEQIERGLANEK